jgi:hypothetical protein
MSEIEEQATEVMATEVLATEVMATEVVATEVVATQPMDEPDVPGTLLLTEPLEESPAEPTKTKEYRRVGPGVPVPVPVPAPEVEKSAPTIDPAIAAAWHGLPPEKQRRRLHRGWLLPLAVLIGVIILLLWQNLGSRLSVSSATASAGTPTIGCDSTEIVTATLHTNGGAGTIIYRWARSDGTFSDELRQSVSSGTKSVDVVLRWAFTGHGSMDASARVEVESPGTASAAASFVYACP